MSSKNGAAHRSSRKRLDTLPDEEVFSTDEKLFSERLDLDYRKQQAVTALHENFDRLSALWIEKEKELVAMHVPMHVWHFYSEVKDEQGVTDNYHIGLAPWRGQWRLLHAIEHVQTGENEIKPIVEASLDCRLAAAEHFEGLMKKVIEAAEKSVENVEAAIVALSR